MLEGVHELDGGLGSVDNARLSGELIHSLGQNLLASLFGFNLLGVILSHSSLEGFTALTSTHVFNPDMDSLGNDSASNLFVDDNSNSVLVNIEDLASFSVVELVGHTLVNATVSNDVNEVALFIDLHDL